MVCLWKQTEIILSFWRFHRGTAFQTLLLTININNLRYTDDTTLMAQSEEELKSLLMKVKEESGKVSLKLNIQKTNIMATGSVTSWQVDGETMETVRDFILGGSKITADGDYSHEIKRRLLLGRKAMTTLLLLLLSRFSRVRLCVTP